MPKQRGYTVFEIVNEQRHEIYVGATRDPISQMPDAIRRRRPKSIKDWDLDDMKPIRSIEVNMGEKDARDFIGNYVKIAMSKAWHFLP